MLRRIATLPLRFYRRFVSPLKPPTCRFAPTCSQYAIEAIEVHGVFVGSALATWRILRCQPFGKSGFDPVPPLGWSLGRRAFQRKREHHSHEHCGSIKSSVARDPSADA
jgi:putative membrane protein insertion efficiency factor